MDLATLVIRIDASQVGPAQAALKGLGAEGVRVQTATGGATVGMGRLNNAILGLARQASGAHPVIARFTDVLFSMALGGVAMTAVLAGLAAVAVAWNRIGREAREAKDRLREAQAVLEGLRSDQQLAGIGGEVGRAIRMNIQERNRLAAERASLGPNTPFGEAGRRQRSLDQQIANLDTLIGAGENELDSRAAADRARERRERLRQKNASIAAGVAFREAEFRQGEAARMRNASLEATANLLRQRGMFEGRRMGTAQPLGLEETTDRFGARLAERKRQLDAWFAYQQDAEDALNQRRLQANQALIVSLANVGRAYGGVVDQVLNLTAATMSIAQAGRLPGFGKGETASRGDMAVGLGSAALTGIGFGTSTGNAGLGGLGGAASGFAMSGPWGALVGGVTGIVSGLLEQGQRAQEAARQWKMAFEDFSLMFDDVDPLAARLRANERAFQQLSGGLTPAGARDVLGQGADDFMLEKIFGVTRAELEALLVEYEKNAVQANELAVAEKRLHDARRDVLQALNAPAGLNLAAYGYEASSSGGTVININVSGAGNPRDVATQVFEEARRLMRQGGGSPYLDVVR